MHAAEASGPCSAKEPKQIGFGLVVPRVRDGHNRRLCPRRRPFEKCLTRVVRGLLDRPSGIVREPGHVRAFDVDWDGQRRGKPPAEFLVLIRFGSAQRVVKMRSAREAKSRRVRDLGKHVQQRHRVGPARQRHNDTSVSFNQSVTTDRSSSNISWV